jgi:hypothetical protein
MGLENSVVHALPAPYVCLMKQGVIADLSPIKKKSFDLKSKLGKVTVGLGTSDHGGVKATITFSPSRKIADRLYFVQVVRSSDGNEWAHGADNVLTKSGDVWPRTDPRSGYRIDNRYGKAFFSQQDAMTSTDGADLRVVGCEVGYGKTKAKLVDPAGGYSTAARLANVVGAKFFRFEAMASLMNLRTKNILDSVEWVFDVAFKGRFTMSDAGLLVYQPALLSQLLKSKDESVRGAALSRLYARNDCFTFWNEELVAKNVKMGVGPTNWEPVPGTLANWAHEAENLT